MPEVKNIATITIKFHEGIREKAIQPNPGYHKTRGSVQNEIKTVVSLFLDGLFFDLS